MRAEKDLVGTVTVTVQKSQCVVKPNELSIPTNNQTTFASQCKRKTGSSQNGETDPDDRPCAVKSR